MTIKAIVRGGRLETERPIDLPDGTEVRIELLGSASEEEGGWDNSPEGIAAWLAWADSLEPLIFTEAEPQAWETERQARKEWEKAHFQEYAEKLKRMWE
jgi:hypothetical protein